MKRFNYRPSRWALRPGRVVSFIAKRLLRLFGWRVEGSIPDVPKMVSIGAFHTSNWDFVIMLLGALQLHLKAYWIGKETLFKGPFGKVMRFLGGIPIRRDKSYNAVQQVVDTIKQRDDIFLVVAPEGTRRFVDHWKTGFYWMAHGADVPIMLAYINYEKKLLCVGELLYPTGDIEADFAIMREFYNKNAAGLYPEKEGTIAVRPQFPKS